MPNIPQDLSYTAEHEYIRLSPDGVAQIGITDFAQGELGDIVFVELPRVGTKFAARDVFGTVEAVKAVSELVLARSPVRSPRSTSASTRNPPSLIRTPTARDGCSRSRRPTPRPAMG